MLKLLSWECLLGSATNVSAVNGPRGPGSGTGKPPGSHLKKRKREKKIMTTVAQRTEGENGSALLEGSYVIHDGRLRYVICSKHIVNHRASMKRMASRDTKPKAELQWNLDVFFCVWGAPSA